MLPPQRPKIIDTPPERPKEPQPEKPKQTRNYDPNVIAKLIGQTRPSTPAVAPTLDGFHHAPGAAASRRAAHVAFAGLGARRVADGELPQLLDAPAGHAGRRHLRRANQGDLQPRRFAFGRPVLLNPPTDPAWRAHAESAMRAVKKCDPLKVPAQYAPYFDQWKVETIHFDPRETQG